MKKTSIFALNIDSVGLELIRLDRYEGTKAVSILWQ
jgi:hypothetical protein